MAGKNFEKCQSREAENVFKLSGLNKILKFLGPCLFEMFTMFKGYFEIEVCQMAKKYLNYPWL